MLIMYSSINVKKYERTSWTHTINFIQEIQETAGFRLFLLNFYNEKESGSYLKGMLSIKNYMLYINQHSKCPLIIKFIEMQT